MKRTIVGVVLVLFAMGLVPTTMAAGLDCQKWNTGEFFKEATPADVTRCLKAGADLNASDEFGRTPLHLAAGYNENPAALKALLAAGADPNARAADGDIPLGIAVRENGYPAVLKALLAAGAAPNARGRFGERSPLHEVGFGYFNDRPAVVKVLLAAGADLNVRDRFGRNLLHTAAAAGRPPTVLKFLLAAGVDLNSRTEDGSTPLHMAARSNDPAVIQALLDAGADPSAKDSRGRFPWDDARDSAWNWEELKDHDVYWRLNDGRFGGR